jgi:hypothetical protein
MAKSSNIFNYEPNLDSKLDLIALTLYWAEGSKFRKRIELTNSDHKSIILFSKFLLERCNVDPNKLKGRLQIHDKNYIEEAKKFWSESSGVSIDSISVSIKPTKVSCKTNKHPYGIFSIIYNSVGLRKIIDEAIDQVKCLDS